MKSSGLSGHILYGQLALPLAFAGLPLYIHAPDFYAANFGLSLGFIGVVLLAVRLLDAFADPFIGSLSDRYAHRRPVFMPVTAFFFALSFVALFNPPPAAEPLWFTFCIFLATLSFSVLTINLNSIGSEIAKDNITRTNVSSIREAFGILGLFLAVLLPYVVATMQHYALIISVVTLLSMCVFIFWLLRQKNADIRNNATFGRLNLSDVFKGDAARFFAVYGISIFSSSLPAVLVLFYIRDYLAAEKFTGMFLAIYFLSAILFMPLWKVCARRYGARAVWFFAMGLAALSLVFAAFIGEGAIYAYAIICFFSGAALGAELMLPPAILSSLIDQSGKNHQTSLYFGVYAFFMKIALALASVVAFTALDIAGFLPDAQNESCALITLAFLYALVPAVLKLAAMLLLYRTGEKNEKKLHAAHLGCHYGS